MAEIYARGPIVCRYGTMVGARVSNRGLRLSKVSSLRQSKRGFSEPKSMMTLTYIARRMDRMCDIHSASASHMSIAWPQRICSTTTTLAAFSSIRCVWIATVYYISEQVELTHVQVWVAPVARKERRAGLYGAALHFRPFMITHIYYN